MIASMQGRAAPAWEDVRLFLALYRGRTLAVAARAVALDPSTLSRRLVGLEQALGTRLFDRTREGLVPSEGAELLLPAAEEMEQAHSRFSRDASRFERAVEGVVRLSVPPGLAESLVAPALVRLRQRHPGIQVDLDASLHFADLTRREADLAVRTRRPQTGDLISVKLGERVWTPMAARSALKRRPIRDWGAPLDRVGRRPGQLPPGPVGRPARAPHCSRAAHQPRPQPAGRGGVWPGRRPATAGLCAPGRPGPGPRRRGPGRLGRGATPQRDLAGRPPRPPGGPAGGGGVDVFGGGVRALRAGAGVSVGGLC
jgi:DNA-binding transcriptional LysR family regulator